MGFYVQGGIRGLTIFGSAFDNYFLQAQRVRQLVKDDFDRVFLAREMDVVIHPSAIQTAPELEAEGAETYVQDVLTVPASLAGVPGLSVPMRVDGWPVGVSVIGEWGWEEMVFRIGEVMEGLR